MITFFIVWFALSVPAIYFYEKVVGQQNIFTLFCHVVMAPLSIITTLFLLYLVMIDLENVVFVFLNKGELTYRV